MSFRTNDNTSLYVTTHKWEKFHITFEGLVQLALPEHHAEIVDGAGVELHPEHHISGRASVSFVITLQLRRDVRSVQRSGR